MSSRDTDKPLMQQVSFSREAPWMPCPICGASDFENLATNDRYAMGISTAGCKNCGLVMTNPQPSEKFLEQFYLKDYRLYYQKTERPSENYIKKYGKDRRSEETARFIEKSTDFSKIHDVLDIGASEGSLLKAVRNINPSINAFAVEPNKEFREFAARYVPCATFADSNSILRAGYRFDLIVVNHVLEHIASPVRALRDFGNLLKPNGLLYLEVPDVTHYVGLESLHIAHLYHFSEKSLCKIVAASGFKVEVIRRYAPVMHPPSIGALLSLTNSDEAASTAVSFDGWIQLKRIEKESWKYLLRLRLGKSPTMRRIRKILRYITGL